MKENCLKGVYKDIESFGKVKMEQPWLPWLLFWKEQAKQCHQASSVLNSHESSRENNKSAARYYCGLPEVGLTTPSFAWGGYRYSPNLVQLGQVKTHNTKRGPTALKMFLKGVQQKPRARSIIKWSQNRTVPPSLRRLPPQVDENNASPNFHQNPAHKKTPTKQPGLDHWSNTKHQNNTKYNY